MANYIQLLKVNSLEELKEEVAFLFVCLVLVLVRTSADFLALWHPEEAVNNI